MHVITQQTRAEWPLAWAMRNSPIGQLITFVIGINEWPK